MPPTDSKFAYDDCYGAMDRALEDGKGVRLAFAKYGDAVHFRMRLNKARAIIRKDNLKIYDFTHPMHGHSSYDSLLFKVTKLDEIWYTYVEVAQTRDMEGLSQLEDPQCEPLSSKAENIAIVPATPPDTSLPPLKRRV